MLGDGLRRDDPEFLTLLEILGGEKVAQNRKAFAACIGALNELARNIVAASSIQLPNDVRAQCVHAENLANSIADILTSRIELAIPTSNPKDILGSAQIDVEVGRFMRAYDLDFLRDAAVNSSSSLKNRPRDAGPTLHVLVPLLQTWVDFIIPSSLDDLEARAREHHIAMLLPHRAQSQLDAYQRERRVSSLERQAEETFENLRQAAGEGAKERLAQTFEFRAREETRSASSWNKLVMLFVALGIVLPLIAISFGAHFLGQLTGMYGVTVKALIGLPMFALATYSGRISAQHRAMAQHMKLLVAQIDSVKAYVAPLATETQQDIIAALGRRAFSDPESERSTAGTVGIPPEDILPVLEKALETIKQIRK